MSLFTVRLTAETACFYNFRFIAEVLNKAAIILEVCIMQLRLATSVISK